jgi:hypothetical protein
MLKAKIFNGRYERVASEQWWSDGDYEVEEVLPDPEEVKEIPEYLKEEISYEKESRQTAHDYKVHLCIDVEADQQFNLWREHNPEVELDFEKHVCATASGITIFYEEGD